MRVVLFIVLLAISIGVSRAASVESPPVSVQLEELARAPIKATPASADAADLGIESAEVSARNIVADEMRHRETAREVSTAGLSEPPSSRSSWHDLIHAYSPPAKVRRMAGDDWLETLRPDNASTLYSGGTAPTGETEPWRSWVSDVSSWLHPAGEFQSLFGLLPRIDVKMGSFVEEEVNQVQLIEAEHAQRAALNATRVLPESDDAGSNPATQGATGIGRGQPASGEGDDAVLPVSWKTWGKPATQGKSYDADMPTPMRRALRSLYLWAHHPLTLLVSVVLLTLLLYLKLGTRGGR